MPLMMRDDSNFLALFKQTVKAVQNLFIDIAGSDMIHEEFKDFCKKA